MKKIILPIAAMLVLSGCFQYKRTTVFNPDGSGKMLLETQLQKGSLLVDDGDDNESMKKAVAVFIKNCRGLEAWTDVKYKINDENSVDFKGTCYFRDISKIKLYNIRNYFEINVELKQLSYHHHHILCCNYIINT